MNVNNLNEKQITMQYNLENGLATCKTTYKQGKKKLKMVAMGCISTPQNSVEIMTKKLEKLLEPLSLDKQINMLNDTINLFNSTRPANTKEILNDPKKSIINDYLNLNSIILKNNFKEYTRKKKTDAYKILEAYIKKNDNNIPIQDKVEILKNLSGMQNNDDSDKVNISNNIKFLYEEYLLSFTKAESSNNLMNLLNSWKDDEVVKDLKHVARLTGLELDCSPIIDALMKIIRNTNETIIFEIPLNNLSSAEQNSNNTQVQPTPEQLTINNFYSSLSPTDKMLFEKHWTEYKKTISQNSSKPKVSTSNYKLTEDDIKYNIQRISDTLGLYDISEELKNIYQNITADTIQMLISEHIPSNNFAIQKRLVIYDDVSKNPLNRINTTNLAVNEINHLQNPEVFNITITKLLQSDTFEIIITPSKKHYLLNGNTWDACLKTAGIDKKLKTSLKINVSNNVDVDLCMKISKRSNTSKSGDKYIEYKGISFRNKNVRKQFIEDAYTSSAGKPVDNLHEKIKNYYEHIMKRILQDPKPDNVLYNHESQEIHNIDVTEIAWTDIPITNILEFFREDYPQAVEAALKNGQIDTDQKDINFSSALTITDDILNLENDYFSLKKYAKLSSTEIITFIDINGNVLRYVKQKPNFSIMETTEEIVLVNNPFDSSRLNLLPKKDTPYQAKKMYNLGLKVEAGELFYDTFASGLLQKKPNILKSYKNEGNKFSPEKNQSDALAPYVFCVFLKKRSLSANSKQPMKNDDTTIAVEMALQIYNEAREYYPHDNIEIPEWLVDKVNKLYKA